MDGLFDKLRQQFSLVYLYFTSCFRSGGLDVLIKGELPEHGTETSNNSTTAAVITAPSRRLTDENLPIRSIVVGVATGCIALVAVALFLLLWSRRQRKIYAKPHIA